MYVRSQIFVPGGKVDMLSFALFRSRMMFCSIMHLTQNHFSLFLTLSLTLSRTSFSLSLSLSLSLPLNELHTALYKIFFPRLQRWFSVEYEVTPLPPSFSSSFSRSFCLPLPHFVLSLSLSLISTDVTGLFTQAFCPQDSGTSSKKSVVTLLYMLVWHVKFLAVLHMYISSALYWTYWDPVFQGIRGEPLIYIGLVWEIPDCTADI